jgi:uncharacterized membrane protein YdjX (TVP38/TMEM64 family)
MARWVRPTLLVLLLITGVTLTVTIGPPPLEEIRDWVGRAGWAGPVVYAAIFAAASLTPAPATVLTVGAGALFGWTIGVPVALAGSLVGAMISFGAARMLGRTTVEGLGGDRLARLDEMVRRRGVAAVIGIRLVPTGPFAIVNAACGLTAVRVRDYAIGTTVGMVPGTVTFVAFGAFGTNPGSLPFLLAVVSLVVLIGVGIVVNRRNAAREKKPAPAPSECSDAAR